MSLKKMVTTSRFSGSTRRPAISASAMCLHTHTPTLIHPHTPTFSGSTAAPPSARPQCACARAHTHTHTHAHTRTHTHSPARSAAPPSARPQGACTHAHTRSLPGEDVVEHRAGAAPCLARLPAPPQPLLHLPPIHPRSHTLSLIARADRNARARKRAPPPPAPRSPDRPRAAARRASPDRPAGPAHRFRWARRVLIRPARRAGPPARRRRPGEARRSHPPVRLR